MKILHLLIESKATCWSPLF